MGQGQVPRRLGEQGCRLSKRLSRRQKSRGRQAPMSSCGGRWSDTSLSSKEEVEERLCAEGKEDHQCHPRMSG